MKTKTYILKNMPLGLHSEFSKMCMETGINLKEKILEMIERELKNKPGELHEIPFQKPEYDPTINFAFKVPKEKWDQFGELCRNTRDHSKKRKDRVNKGVVKSKKLLTMIFDEVMEYKKNSQPTKTNPPLSLKKYDTIDTKDVLVRGMPRALWEDFKAVCQKDGISANKGVIRAVFDKVKNGL